MKCVFCAKEGTTFEAELSIGFIKNSGLVCIIRDVTERKARERQLRFDAAIQASISDAVIVFDETFIIRNGIKRLRPFMVGKLPR